MQTSAERSAELRLTAVYAIMKRHLLLVSHWACSNLRLHSVHLW